MTKPTEAQKADIRRLHAKMGRRVLAERVGLSVRVLRRAMSEMGLSGQRRGIWGDDRQDLAPDGHLGRYTAEDYLRDHAGEMGHRRLAREIGCSRSSVELRMLRLDMRLSELRTDLAVSDVARLVGYSEQWLRERRKWMPWRVVDGVMRIWPSQVRAWILEDPRGRVQWSRVAREDLGDVVGLIVGDWGVSEDS